MTDVEIAFAENATREVYVRNSYRYIVTLYKAWIGGSDRSFFSLDCHPSLPQHIAPYTVFKLLIHYHRPIDVKADSSLSELVLDFGAEFHRQHIRLIGSHHAIRKDLSFGLTKEATGVLQRAVTIRKSPPSDGNSLERSCNYTLLDHLLSKF